MDKGVKKIKLENGRFYPKKSKLESNVVIEPDQFVFFGISEWYAGTTKEDKAKPITWLRQSADRKTILNQMSIPSGQKYGIKIPKKLCGNFYYYIEASLSGKRDKTVTGIKVGGYCPAKIVSSKWSTKPDSANIKNTPGIVMYGNVVYLSLQTEGLNFQMLTVEVYNRVRYGATDKVVGIYTGVDCSNGEVSLEIRNTYSWLAKMSNRRQDEDFYIMVKDPATGQYVSDNLNQTKHAVYLKIKNQVVTTIVDGARNNKVAKVGQAETNYVRFEKCKFSTIEISESIKEIDASKPVKLLVFDEKKPKVDGIVYETVAPGINFPKELKILVGGYNTKKCIPKNHLTKKGIFKEIGQKEEPTDKSVALDLNTGEINRKVYSDLSRFNAFPIQYIWPASTTPNLFYYYINSCAYYPQPTRPTVTVKVYPDIKWEMKFDFGSDIALEERYKNMPSGKQAKGHHKTALKSGTNRFRLSESSTSEVFFGFTLKAIWNNKNSEAEFNEKYVNTIRNFLGVFVKIKEWIDEASHLNKTKGGNKTLAQRLISGAKRVPVTLKFYYPTISVTASWWLEHSKSNPAVVETQGSLKFGFTPLIKAEGILDLLFYAELIPVAGQIIKVLDVAVSVAGVEAIFTLTAFGELNVTAEFFDFYFRKAQLDFKGKVGLKLDLSVKASGKIYIIVFEADYKFEASGSAESYFEPRGTIGKDAAGVFIEQQIDFSGLRIVLIIKGQIKKSKTQIKRTFVLVDRKEKITHGKKYIINSI